MADLWRWSPRQCLVGLPHSQKPTSCVGVRQTDWNSTQSSALPSLTCRGWTLSDTLWGEKNRLRSLPQDCYILFFFFFHSKQSENHAEKNTYRWKIGIIWRFHTENFYTGTKFFFLNLKITRKENTLCAVFDCWIDMTMIHPHLKGRCGNQEIVSHGTLILQWISSDLLLTNQIYAETSFHKHICWEYTKMLWIFQS